MKQTVNNQKAFCRLQGGIKKALKYINDSESLAGGVHNLTKEILEQLRLYKHPHPGSEDPSVLPDITPNNLIMCRFLGIDALCGLVVHHKSLPRFGNI